MTPPPATTAAGRRATTAAVKASGARVAGAHKSGVPVTSTSASRVSTARARTPERTSRRTVNQVGAAPRSPRRVSGPARPARQAAAPVTQAAVRSAVKPATRAAASPSSRGAARPAGRAAASPTTRGTAGPAARAAEKRVTRPRQRTVTTPQRSVALHLPGLAVLPRPHLRLDGLVDGFVRGRAWIPVLAVLLVGIVAMRVEVLKLGASVGRSMNVATELQGQNEIDRAQDSMLDSPSRIERLGTSMGLQEPGPTDSHFVGTHTSIAKAISGIHAPDTAAFQATLATQRAADDTPVTSTGGTPATGAPLTPTDAASVTPTDAAPVTPTDAASVTPTGAASVTPTGAASVTPTDAVPVTGGASVTAAPVTATPVAPAATSDSTGTPTA